MQLLLQVPMRCELCIYIHSQRALAHASKQKIAESIDIATFIAAGSQICWTNVYSKKFNSIFKKRTLETRKKERVLLWGLRKQPM